MDESAPTNVRYKLSRSAGGLWEQLQANWQKKWFRLGAYAVGGLVLGYILLWAVLLRNLPTSEVSSTARLLGQLVPFALPRMAL